MKSLTKWTMIAALAAGLALPGTVARAETKTVDGVTWTYTVTYMGATVNGASPAAGALAVPSTLGPSSVTSIGNSAFSGCSSLTSVSIPGGVTSIGNYAFRYCSGLAGVTLPDSLTSIGNSAFYGCSALTGVEIPDSVTGIGDSAFSYCSGLTSVTIPDSVTSIGNYVFSGCRGLRSVTIPDSVTNIGYSAFNSCSGLAGVTIPESVTSIGSYAFAGCNRLGSVTIPDSVASFGNYAFSGCDGLAWLFAPGEWEGTGRLTYAGLPEGCQVLYGVTQLAVGTAELPPAVEQVGYSVALKASGGTEPYAWEAMAAGYEEVLQAGTYVESGEDRGWKDSYTCWDLELPFGFPFFGNVYTKAKVDSSGAIAFDDQYYSMSYYDAGTFLASPTIAAMLGSFYLSDGGVYVDRGTDWVKIQWRGHLYPSGGPVVNFSATLHADGKIALSYGEGNAQGGTVGLSAGDGMTALMSELSDNGSLANTDVVFVPRNLPAGMELTEGGVLQGTPDEAGRYSFTTVVSDASGQTAKRLLTLEVGENPVLRPTVAKATPAQGNVNLKTATSKKFSVKATHPTGGTLSYAWSVDGGAVVGTKTNYTYRREDLGLHTVRCMLSGMGLERATTAEWYVGVLTVDGPEDVTLALGQKTVLRADVTSSLPAIITWFDGNGKPVGTGNTLQLNNLASTSQFHAEARSAMGTVTGRTATVTVDTRPAVGRIHKLTGAPFLGNRLVLRAKAYGDLSGASYSWKRDGKQVATTERLDIASLGAGDFGTYTLTVTTPQGSATSGEYVLSPAPAGVPETWGYFEERVAPVPAPAPTPAPAAKKVTAPGAAGVSGMVQISGGYNLNAALLLNGTVSVWGDDQGSGACEVPEVLSGVSQVAVGGNTSAQGVFAVKTDGSVASWGRTYSVFSNWYDYAHSEYDPETGTWQYTGDWMVYTNGVDFAGLMPEGLTDVVKVSLSESYALALTADGNVTGWGADYYATYMPVPAGLSDVVDIAAGNQFALALTADGTVVAWGMQQAQVAATAVPADLPPAVKVAAAGGFAGIALLEDGTLATWGDQQDWYGLRDVPVSDAVFTDVSANSANAVALDAAGNLQAWGSMAYQGIPSHVQGAALGVAAGSAHFTALLADTDGDSIADVLEPRYGRNPQLWEPWERVSVGGTVKVDGNAPVGSVEVVLLDAEGNELERTIPNTSGVWSISGVLPGNYALRVEAADAVDGLAEVSTLGGAATGLDFNLEPGEGVSLARVEAHLAGSGTVFDEDACTVVDLPTGTATYLDMWPAEPEWDGTIDLGEVANGYSALDGTFLVPHVVTVKRPEAGAQIPVPAPVAGLEGATVVASPHFSSGSGSVRIVTVPAGAEVWVDYADAPLGVTPLTVGNLSAAASHSHTLLLKKDGYLRPRPVEFRVEAGTVGEISVPLAAASQPAMSVALESAIPGMDIYVDYLPTGEVTPAMVGGMDPASYAGTLWHSASHSILLRHPKMHPFAPRAVPEEKVFDEATGEWRLVLDSSLSITAPNTYDDSDGDGVRNDVEVETGTNPFNPADYPSAQVTTFKGNGGTPATQKTTNAIGVAYGTLPTPKWSGHIFLGWFTKADGGTEVTSADKVTAAASRTLYAHWTDRQVTTFKGNGGKPATQVTTNTIYAEYGAMPTATRSGQAFLGWFNAAEGGKQVYENSKVTLAATRTLYAHWTDRQVTTFKGNGGTPATQKTTNTIYTAYGTFPDVEWADHAFLGWFNDPTDGKRVYTNSTVTLAATRTLYAHWATQQVVTFKGNGGTPASKVVTNTMGAAYGMLPTPKWSGHVFLGWFTAATGGTEVTSADKVTTETARTLYAHWTDRQITTFKGNGGKPATQATTNTIYADYGTFPEAKWSGHALVGWFTAPEGGKRVYTNSTVTLAATRTLYAQWTTEQVTTFKGNGGTPATQKTTNTIYAAYGTLPEVAWADHAFLGWFNNPTEGKRVYTNSTVTLAATRTLYAHWATQQVVTFKGNGGTPASKVVTNTMGAAYGTLPTPKWSGHVFLGWFTAATGGTEMTSADKVTTATARTLYAHWTDRQITTFKGNGGKPATQVTTNTIYADYGAFPEAKWSGHALVGWFNAPEGGKRVYTNSTVTLAATRTLYAQWTTNQVTTFKGNGGSPEIQKTTNAIYTAYGTFPEATWDGHTFLGWYNAASGGKRVYTNSTVTLAATRTLYAHWSVAKSARGFLISGMALDEGTGGGLAARTSRAAEPNGRVCTIRFEAEAGVGYEIQWTPALCAEWTTLETWAAENDTAAEVEVELPYDAPTGFFRVVALENAEEVVE